MKYFFLCFGILVFIVGVSIYSFLHEPMTGPLGDGPLPTGNFNLIILIIISIICFSFAYLLRIVVF